MKALVIDGEKKELKEIDIEMQANTVYTFFNSILIDELGTLNQHMIYSDANALSLKKTPYFIGGQLIVGDALITGQNGMQDCDITIPTKDLELLLNYDVSPFYLEVIDLLSSSDLNLYRTFELIHKDENIQLNLEWLLHIFNIADDKTKDYFINELKKVIDSKESVEEYVYKMSGLAINASRK